MQLFFPMTDRRSQLKEVVTRLAGQMHPSRIDRIASVIRGTTTGRKDVPHEWTDILSMKEGRLLFDRWRATTVTAEELAGMLIGASHAYHTAKDDETVQLVWTGPTTEFVATRKTEQVLLEVIRSAKRKLFMTSFVAFRVDSVVEALSNAMERGVEVSILLESSRSHGGDLSIDSIDIMRNSLPKARFYYWKEKADKFSGGKVHAKVVVADAEDCFISSANLTEHAMERNMEAGVLISRGMIPRNLDAHLEALVAAGDIAEVATPSEAGER